MAGTIVHQGENMQVVQLSSEFHPGYYDGSIALLFGTIFSSSVHLRRMSDDEETQKFTLSEDEMNALCEAWGTYKVAQEAKAQAEAERQKAIIEEAYALAGFCKEIKIKEHPDYYGPGNMAWEVSIPAIAHRYAGYASSPEALRKRVQDCVSAWESYQKLLAEAASEGEKAF